MIISIGINTSYYPQVDVYLICLYNDNTLIYNISGFDESKLTTNCT